MKTRVTQTDIARVAGVHNTTVSLALRNSPAIPEQTRKRIHAIAEEMGYHPDPALQALVAYRNSRMSNRRQETIAYVTNWTSRWGWQDLPAHARIHAGAQRKAAQAGFQLEHFWFGEAGMSPRRFSSMLFHRGITGVILASYRPDCDVIRDLDWSRLSAIKVGCFPHDPALNRVIEDHTGVMRLAMRRVLAAGYARAGLVLPNWCDEFADQGLSAGFLTEQFRLPEEDRIPILLHGPAGTSPLAGNVASPVDASTLKKWVDRYDPDVVIGFGPSVPTQLARLGLSVPRDIAYVDLSLGGSEPGVAGVRDNCERVGEVATELLISQMHQNVCGLPDVATSTLVEGMWVDGATLPPARPVIPWSAARCATGDGVLAAAS